MSFVISPEAIVDSFYNESEGVVYSLNQLIQRVHRINNQFPSTFQKWKEEYAKSCRTIYDNSVLNILGVAIDRWRIERVPQGDSDLWYKNPRIGDYAYLYRHPGDGRFCGIPAKRAVEYSIKQWESCTYCLRTTLVELARLWLSPDSYTWYPVHTGLKRREVQEKLGVYLKVGKVCKHAIDFQNEAYVSTFASFVQDALNEEDSELEKVQVSDDGGEVYVKGGYFTSCMKDMPQETFEIYTDFGAKCAYIEENGELLARAVLWNRVHNNGTVFRMMDTIYSRRNEYEATLIKWAKANDYLYKVTQSYKTSRLTNGNYEVILEPGAYVEALDEEFSFTPNMYDHVPWLDTFSGLEQNGRRLLHNTSHSIQLRCTTGTDTRGYLAEPICKCEACGDSINEDDAYRDGDGYVYCETCFYDRYSYCEHCGEVVNNEDLVSTDNNEYLCEHCAENRGYVRCEDCGTWTRNIYSVDDGDYHYCEDCVDRNASCCDDCGEWFTDTKEHEGERLCEDCFDNHYFQCDICGEIHDRNEEDPERIRVRGRGDYTERWVACQNCLDTENRGLYYCVKCGEYHFPDDRRPHRFSTGETWCEACLKKEIAESRKEEAVAIVNHK